MSVKVAPGVRLSASSRGVRGHLGPRVARVHVGGGRSGISTGAGPFTVYESLGGSPRKNTQGMTPKQAERMQQVDLAARQLNHLENLHRQDFAGPVRQLVAAAALPKFSKLLGTAEKRTLRGVSPFDREVRRSKRREARLLAERWALDLMTLAEDERRSKQDSIDLEWAALHSNQPLAVGRALAAAFRASSRPVRVVGVEDGEAHLVVTVDGQHVVPESKPATTPSGAPTLHKLTKTDRAAWHRQVVASQILLTAKEAMATAPALEAVRVVAVDQAGTATVAARVGRRSLDRADWRTDAWRILTGLDPETRCSLRARTHELLTIDLKGDAVYGAIARD